MDISDFLPQDDIYNTNNNNFKGRIFIYNEFPQELRKKRNGLFYYNEEEKNKNLKNLIKNFESRNQNKNNLLFINKSKTKEETEKKIFLKKNSLINFVAKEDKNKNLKIKRINNNAETGLFLNMVNDKLKNNFINNRDLSSNIFSKFNFNKLESINANFIKIISQTVTELPKTQVCYFTREYKYNEDLLFSKPSKIPHQEICFYKKSYIYNDNRIILPKAKICYFNKIFINFQHNHKRPIVIKRYFCTKIMKLKKNKEKKKQILEQKNLKNKNMIEMNNKRKNTRFSATIDRNRRKSPTKKGTQLNFKRNPFTNSKLKSFQTFNQEDIINRYGKKNIILPKNINSHKKVAKSRIKSKSPKYKKIEKFSELPNLINHQKEVTSTSSSNERGRKNSSLFQNILQKKEKSNKINRERKSKNKFALNKNINNNYENRNNDKTFIPKIKDSIINTTYKTTKTKISQNILTSKDLIKKINFAASLDKDLNKNNNKQLLNNKKQNSYDYLPNKIMNYNHKEEENNFIKCDIHYNSNNLLCPNYNPDQQRNSLIDESKTLKILKINSHFLKKNMELQPSAINDKNKNDKTNIFERFKIKSKSFAPKKINFSNNKNDLLKNYKSGFLAIKEYFNIY